MYSFIKSLNEAPVMGNRIATSANTPKTSGETPGGINFDPNVGKQFVKKEPKSKSGTKSEFLTPELIELAKDRPTAIQMTTILGAMYQARNRNPNVQMTPPMLVTGIKDETQKENMMTLFNIAKYKTIAQLATMSQEIKKASIPKEGEGQVNQGGTPTEQQHAQEALNLIKHNSANLSAENIQLMLKALENAGRRVGRNKNNLMKASQPQPSAGVINTG
jgi:hypothetical protein